MKQTLIGIVVSLVMVSSAAGMSRVVEIIDSRTIVIVREARPERLILSSIVVPPADEGAAVAYLRRILVGQWILIERDRTSPGHAYVYRSPDALFINGEIARRAYAHTGTPMTYLGEAIPGGRPARTRVKPTPAPKLLPIPRPHRRPHGASKIPRLPPSRPVEKPAGTDH